MFTGLFGWLRTSVKAAVLGGVQDACDELAALRSAPAEYPRLTGPATTEPDAEEPASKRPSRR